jgi:hypothetical protein
VSGSGELDHLRGAAVGDDRGHVALAEALGGGRDPQRLVDRVCAVELGQVDRLGHLAPHP